jgi:hypothetical protein
MRSPQPNLNELICNEATLAVLRADGLSVDTFRATLRAAAERMRARRLQGATDEEREPWFKAFEMPRIGAPLACCGD